MKYNYKDNKDYKHIELCMLLANVAHLAGIKDRRIKNKNMREGTRLNGCLTRGSWLSQVYREMDWG